MKRQVDWAEDTRRNNLKLQKIKEIEDATKQDKIAWEKGEYSYYATYGDFDLVVKTPAHTGVVYVNNIFLGDSANINYLIDSCIQRQEIKVLEGLNFDEN